MLKAEDTAKTAGVGFDYNVYEASDWDQHKVTILDKANRMEKTDKRNKAVAKSKPTEKQISEAFASFSPEEFARTKGDGNAIRKLAKEIILRGEVA